jgi:electron transfer flavoprotein alpha subunit
MGATGLGRDPAGAVATRLETGLTADCTACRSTNSAAAGADVRLAATSWPRFSRKRPGQMASVGPM